MKKFFRKFLSVKVQYFMLFVVANGVLLHGVDLAIRLIDGGLYTPYNIICAPLFIFFGGVTVWFLFLNFVFNVCSWVYCGVVGFVRRAYKVKLF